MQPLLLSLFRVSHEITKRVWRVHHGNRNINNNNKEKVFIIVVDIQVFLTIILVILTMLNNKNTGYESNNIKDDYKKW